MTALILAVSLCMNDISSATAITYDAATTEYFETIDDYGQANGTDSITLRFGGTLGEFLRFNQTLGKFILSDDLDVQGTASGTALTIMGGNSYFLGRLGVGTSATPDTQLEVVGTISGSSIRAGSLSVSGSFTLEQSTTLSGSTIRGFGLNTDCDTAGTSKLLWDATTGRFSCGTDQGAAYTAGQGLNLSPSNAFSLKTTITGSLVSFRTLSGATLTVNGSGTIRNTDPNDVVLIVKGAPSQSANLQNWTDSNDTMLANITANGNLNVNASINTTGNTTLGDSNTDTITFNADVNSNINADSNNSFHFGNASNRWVNGWFVSLNVGGQIDAANISATTNVSAGNFNATNNLNISGHSLLGSDTSDSINFAGDVNSSFNPDANNTYEIGNASNRWVNGWFDSVNLSANITAQGTATINGNVGIGPSNTTTKAVLNVSGVMSGVTLYATRSFSGAGLTSCSDGTTSKLLWNATTGRFSCGTDQTGGSSGGGLTFATASGIFLKRSGGTMTGALTIDIGAQGVRGNGTGLVVYEKAVFLSGATLSGQLLIQTNGDPGTPAAGNLYLYAKSVADRSLLKVKGPSGVDYALQPSFFQNNIALWFPATSTTAGHIFGWTFTSAGTVSHPTLASTNILTQMRRTRWASATTANAVGGIFSAQTLTWRGNAAGLGGFFFYARFGQAINTNGGRAFVGLAAATSHVVAAEPNAAVNMVGMGYDAADSSAGNWRVYTNDASGTATETDLGSGAPRDTLTVYDLFIFAAPNGSAIGVRVTNVSTGLNVYDESLSSDLPVNTTFLRAHAGGGPAASVAAQNFELNRLYLETDT